MCRGAGAGEDWSVSRFCMELKGPERNSIDVFLSNCKEELQEKIPREDEEDEEERFC